MYGTKVWTEFHKNLPVGSKVITGHADGQTDGQTERQADKASLSLQRK
jgi:hypothetical protein